MVTDNKTKVKKTTKTVNHNTQSGTVDSQQDDELDDQAESDYTDDGSRPIIKKSVFSMSSFDAEKDLPIVYNDNYNMSMVGIQVLHQFDTKKYGKIASILNDLFSDTQYARLPDKPDPEGKVQKRHLRFMTPNRPVNQKELGLHHTEEYLHEVFNSRSLIARITETWALNLVPMFLLKKRVLTPLRWQVAGTIFATHLAMQHGWSINLGGGFHTAAADNGETFSIFSDICIAIKYVWRKHPLQKFLILDSDAHQATGIERDLVKMDKKKRHMIHMLDIYNETVQPPDEQAEKGIDTKVALARFTGDDTYKKRLKQALDEAVSKFKPTVIIYIAGQDVLKDDQLGLLNLSDEAYRWRDEAIFSLATETLRLPIVMLLGGGYLARDPKVMADSVRHLFAKGLIWGGHRSGARSLSRPRRQNSDPKINKNGGIEKSKSKSKSISIGKKTVKAGKAAPKVVKSATGANKNAH